MGPNGLPMDTNIYIPANSCNRLASLAIIFGHVTILLQKRGYHWLIACLLGHSLSTSLSTSDDELDSSVSLSMHGGGTSGRGKLVNNAHAHTIWAMLIGNTFQDRKIFRSTWIRSDAIDLSC